MNPPDCAGAGGAAGACGAGAEGLGAAGAARLENPRLGLELLPDDLLPISSGERKFFSEPILQIHAM